MSYSFMAAFIRTSKSLALLRYMSASFEARPYGMAATKVMKAFVKAVSSTMATAAPLNVLVN